MRFKKPALDKIDKHITAQNLQSIRNKALELYKSSAPYSKTDPQINLAAVYTQAVLDELQQGGIEHGLSIKSFDSYDGSDFE